jgi:hypothetical protein
MLGELEFNSQQGQEIIPLHCVQTGSGTHPVYCPIGTGGQSCWSVKLTTGLHLEPRARMVELYLHSPYDYMAWCLFNYMQGKIIFDVVPKACT